VSLRSFLWIIVAIGCLCVDTVGAAARTLDLVTFTPPPGWTVEERAGGIGKHVVMSRSSATSYWIALDFFGLQNGRKLVEKSTGVVTLSSAGVLVITMTDERSCVLRGWLEGPTMTVMTLNGPWYEDIPAAILTNPDQGWNLDKYWVRMRPKK
jgi:hypothetical protein